MQRKVHISILSLSLHTEVWLGYTLKQCREMEISLGLDLKGGYELVVLELNVADVIPFPF